MNFKLLYLFVIVLLNFAQCRAIQSKFKFIGDCEWTSNGNKNDSLIFICYDHYHEDRFFDYDAKRKPCLNSKQGYIKDEIGDMAFRNCEISKITVDIMEYYRHIWRLDISDIGLTSLDKENFNGNHGQTVRILLASRNRLTEIKANLFANAKRVTDVDFSSNHINRVDPLAFNDAKELRMLDLSSNSLLKLENQMFAGLKNLHTLYLHVNGIQEIDLLAFSGATNLSRLELSFNNITQIDPRSFEGIPLAHLNLSHNAISETTLMGLRDLEFDLSYNNMTTLTETFGGSSTIKMLVASHNLIKNIHSIGNFSDLIELDVSYNAVASLGDDAFLNLVNLAILNLASNPIQVLQSKIFSSNLNLRQLNLSHTCLTFIESGTFFKPHKLQSIDLTGNNFEKFDFNVFLPRLDGLRELFLDGNRLIDLNGFRRSLFPQLSVLGLQNNAFNCSYLSYFFETIVWHELSIRLDRTDDVSDVNVGGIRCKANNEDEKLITTTTSMEFLTVDTTTTLPEQTTVEAVSHVPPESKGNATNEVTGNHENGSNFNVEFLLVALCVILSAFFIFYVIVHKDRFLAQIGCPRRRQSATGLSFSGITIGQHNNLSDHEVTTFDE